MRPAARRFENADISDNKSGESAAVSGSTNIAFVQRSEVASVMISAYKIFLIENTIASSQALPALKVAIDDECSGKGLAIIRQILAYYF